LFPDAWKRHERPTSPGLVNGRLVFTSGQVGIDQRTGELVGEGTYEQTAQALHNLEEVLREAGGSLADLTKVTVYLANRTDIAEMNRAYAAVIPQPWPARSTVLAGLARPELRVEIEGVAVLSSSDFTGS